MKISILTPTFNSGKYIKRAIESVLAQGDDNFEHIIVDGGSTDDTVSILNSYSHIRWISEPDFGQSDAMNKAYGLMKGDWMTYLNADDYFNSGAFSHLRSVVNKNPDIDLVVGTLNISDAEKDSCFLHSPSSTLDDIIPFWRWRFPLNPVSYFYRKKVQETIGLFPLDNHLTMDYWFLLRAFSLFRICPTQFTFGTFVQTGENKSAQRIESLMSLWSTLNQFQIEAYKKTPELAFAEFSRCILEDLDSKNEQVRGLVSTVDQSLWWRIGKFLGLVKKIHFKF